MASCEPDHAVATVRAPEEVAEIGWFDTAKLPSPLFLCFKNVVTGHRFPRLPVGVPLVGVSEAP